MKCSEMRQVRSSCCLDGNAPRAFFFLLPRDRVKGEGERGNRVSWPVLARSFRYVPSVGLNYKYEYNAHIGPSASSHPGSETRQFRAREMKTKEEGSEPECGASDKASFASVWRHGCRVL